MTFGPDSTNPRERRSYADAMLAKASASGTLEDYEAAQAAVVNAGNSAKSRRAGFQNRLASAALSDQDTRVIVTVGREVLDSTATPPVDGLGNAHIQLKLQERGSPDFVMFQSGVASHRGYWQRPSDGVVENFSELTLAEHGNSGKVHTIPLVDHETVDVAGVRALPDQVRSEMASLALRIAEPTS